MQFKESDIKHFKSKEIEISTVEKQLASFENGFSFVELIAPATTENGLISFTDEEVGIMTDVYNKYSHERDVVKFVPASGAASRMFQNLFLFREAIIRGEKLKEYIADKSFNSINNFFSNIRSFAFYNELSSKMKSSGLDIEECLADKKYLEIINTLLDDKGLNYSKSPKALLLFHKYGNSSRMAFEEHLVEGGNYCKMKNGRVNIHFTVSVEHLEMFKQKLALVVGKYEKQFDVKYSISYSVQKPSTDMVAVELDNSFFRQEDGSILFRPGGHGALIENLNDLNGDIIFIKNIDNVVPDRIKAETYCYKKVIGGYLLHLQKKSFDYLRILKSNNYDNHIIDTISSFASKALMIPLPSGFEHLTDYEQASFLKSKMDRPMRVCGMVKNEGEPGGGPFWIRDAKGETSLQIVESSQIDHENIHQKEIAQSATHFNPVDLVCGIVDYKGEKFNLKEYIDSDTGFISEKSKNGRKLKAQELPGLWNGAMAKWITVFVEVPIITFNPVKTVNDLLRIQHQ